MAAACVSDELGSSGKASMKATLTCPEPLAVTLDARSSALVIVDMQNEYVQETGKAYMPRAVGALQSVLPLLATFRAACASVIFVQSVRREDALQFTRFGRPLRLIEGSWGAQLVQELSPLPGESLVQKRTHDCFYETAFEHTLSAAGLHPGEASVVVTGVATHGCVDCAVTGLSIRDFQVYVPIDCTAGYSKRLELIGFEHFLGPGYDYNVKPTASNLISFQRGDADRSKSAATTSSRRIGV